MIELAEYTEKVKKYVRKDTLRKAAEVVVNSHDKLETGEVPLMNILIYLKEAILNLENDK